MNRPQVALVLVAAGTGERLGAGVPKALVGVAGRTLLAHALERVRAVEAIGEVVVVHTPGQRAAFAADAGDAVALVEGGATRTESVRRGVAALTGTVEVIAVHDAARGLTPPEVIARAVAAVTGEVVAAAPGSPVADTLKRVDEGAVATVSRDDLWAVHTPQVVRADVLRTALEHDDGEGATDDLGLVERAIAAGLVDGAVRLVEGHPLDLKVTWPRDVSVAEALLSATT